MCIRDRDHIASDGTSSRLLAQGHDSPVLTHPLTERQMLALTDWGTNTANKKAYNVFTRDVYKRQLFILIKLCYIHGLYS